MVVLHDWVLAQFMGQRADFAREALYALGAERGRAFLLGESPLTDPLNRRVLDLALGVLVHSDYVAKLARRAHPNLPVVVAPMPMVVTGQRRLLQESVTFGMVGQVTRNKQVMRCLAAFSRILATRPDARFVIVGESADFDLQSALDSLPAAQRAAITWHGYIPDLDNFRAIIDEIDIVLNLRHPTTGETSAAALRALAQGKPIIVNDVGWYSELPDPVALKVTAQQDDDQLVSAMDHCVEHYAQMSAAAIDYIRTAHAPEKTVVQYLKLIKLVGS
jgi:glycosyltransferase involved in cell wall biosynthesis